MTDLADHLQGALGAIYQLDRELTGGSMSRVFVAVDRLLGRRVVICAPRRPRHQARRCPPRRRGRIPFRRIRDAPTVQRVTHRDVSKLPTRVLPRRAFIDLHASWITTC